MQYIERRSVSAIWTLLGSQLRSPVCSLYYGTLCTSDYIIAPVIEYLVIGVTWGEGGGANDALH
jgi:hypothetical protein